MGRPGAESLFACDADFFQRAEIVVDAIPLTSVGKIYKPELRCDAAARLVRRLVRDDLGLPDARVHVGEGGKRGLCVSVTLPELNRAAVPVVEQALAAYLFESRVTVG